MNGSIQVGNNVFVDAPALPFEIKVKPHQPSPFLGLERSKCKTRLISSPDDTSVVITVRLMRCVSRSTVGSIDQIMSIKGKVRY